MIAVTDFAQGLAAIPEVDFIHSNVLDYLRRNIVEPASLTPYLFVCSEHYTRNLILKTPLFELIAAFSVFLNRFADNAFACFRLLA